MKTTKKKLSLHRETLRALAATDLGRAGGGWGASIIIWGPLDVGGCPTCACSAGTQCKTCDGYTTCGPQC